MKASSLILSLCAALSFLSGCSSPCESVCSSFNDCALSERGNDVDCNTYCGRVEQFEEENADMCAAEFDAHVACWESNAGDICKEESEVCKESADAWTGCMEKFCGEVKAEFDPQECKTCDDMSSGAGACCEQSEAFQDQCAHCTAEDADPECAALSCIVYVNPDDHACVPQEEGPPEPALGGF